MALKRPSGAVLTILGIAAAVIYAADQLSKAWVISTLPEGEVVPVWGNFLQFYFVRNSGAAFSMAAGSTWIFSILAVVVAVVIIVYARKIRSVAWAIVFGLLLGGTFGNLTDRLVRPPSFGFGHVIDFISTPWMMPAIYNVADIAIVSSMVLLVLLTLFGVQLDGTVVKINKKAAESMNYGANPTSLTSDTGTPSSGSTDGGGVSGN